MQPPDNNATPTSQPPPLAGERKAAEQLLDTPRKSGTPRSTRDVTQHRSEILIQMRDEVVHCERWGEAGFDHYLPFEVSAADIDAAIAALKKARLVKDITTADDSSPRLQFTDYPERPSNIETVNEKQRYKPLVDIGKVLQRLKLADGRKASCEFLQKPDNFNEAETNGANFKVDAFLKLLRSTIPPSVQTSTIPVADLAVPSEYKTYRSDCRENRKQLLGTTIFCMNDDPRRKHIYGITIEDETMAVWYFSRSHSAKSPDFNFTEDCRTYIRVMLSLMFATEEELGYDPTVQRRLDRQKNKLCFVYKVDDHYYKTENAIFDHRSLCTTGRATRVWAVVEVASFDSLERLENSRTKVLKDVWLDDGSMTEGEIQREIFTALEKIADDLQADVEPAGFNGMDEESKDMLKKCLTARNWDQYFLTIRTESRGFTSKGVAQAARPDSTLFDAPPATVKPSSFPQADTSRISVSHPAALIPYAKKTVSDRRYRPKQQYRVVFEEVCVALHDVMQLGDVVEAMLDCVFGMQLMFLAGWVHRDLSSGNLYWFKDGESKARGILADLEYAKHFPPGEGKGSSDPKTGTAFFMAVEIQRQSLYKPVFAPPDTPSAAESLSDYDFDTDTPVVRNETGATSAGRVVHNFEHDMESIFWLLLWTLLARFPNQATGDDRSAFEGALSEIFQDTSTCTYTRDQVFSEEGHLRVLLERFLAPQLHPLLRCLDVLRKELMDGYLRRAYNIGDIASYSYLYKYVWWALSICQRYTQQRQLPELLPCRSPLPAADAAVVVRVNRPLQVVKRGRGRRSDGDDDDDFQPRSKTARIQKSTNATSSRSRLRDKVAAVAYAEGDSDESKA